MSIQSRAEINRWAQMGTGGQTGISGHMHTQGPKLTHSNCQVPNVLKLDLVNKYNFTVNVV